MKKMYLLVKEIEFDYEGTDTYPLSVSHDVETLKKSINTEWEESDSGWISEDDDGCSIIRYKISEIKCV